MKLISLIIPKDKTERTPHLFIGILSLASYLKQHNINVKIYDEQFNEATNHIKEINKSNFVGFTVMTSQLQSAKELSTKLHKKDISIIWGGPHPTIFPEQCNKEPYIDYVVKDEGEKAILKIITEKTKKGIINGKDYIDINNLEIDWNLINLNNYEDKSSLIPTGRGCPYNCSFCINTMANKRTHRALTAKNIIKSIKKKGKVNYIDFVDENFFINQKRIKEFCKLYDKKGLSFKWKANSRLEHVKNMSEEMLIELMSCGCVEIRIGIESGNQKVLDEIINKGMKVKDVLPTITRLKSVGIRANCSFMTGLPHETKNEQKDTLNLIKNILRIQPEAHIIGPQLYRPYPDAKMYDEAKKLGFQEPKSIDEWIDFTNKSGFLDIKNISWIKNKTWINNISKIYTYSQINPRSNVIAYLFKWLFKLRIKIDFYYLGIDIWLYEIMKEVYDGIKK